MTGRGGHPSALRRALLLGSLGLSLAPLSHRRAPAASLANPRGGLRRQLQSVRRWGCQYQNIDLVELAASDLDLIAIEPSLDDDTRRSVTADQVEALKRKPDGSRRLVLGYLCVGEADTGRWFWPKEWVEKLPEWLGPENSEWPGSYPVQYWRPEWRTLLLQSSESLLGRIVSAGYDGALLDRVDAFADWQPAVPDAAARMIDLVETVATSARSRRPDFLLVPQNAEPLLQYARYRSTIDGLNKESLLTGLHGPNRFNTPAEVAWSLGYIDQARDAGLKLLATEYASDPAVVRKATKRLRELGFTPFVGRPALDRMPGS